MSAQSEPVMKQEETLPHEQIALRAYSLWQERGSPIGSPEEDWFRAELEIRNEKSQSAQTAHPATAKARTASA